MKLDALFLAGVATGLSACAAAPARAPEVAAETAAFPVTVEGAKGARTVRHVRDAEGRLVASEVVERSE